MDLGTLLQFDSRFNYRKEFTRDQFTIPAGVPDYVETVDHNLATLTGIPGFVPAFDVFYTRDGRIYPLEGYNGDPAVVRAYADDTNLKFDVFSSLSSNPETVYYIIYLENINA